MKCGQCGNENPPEDKFCGECGADLQIELRKEKLAVAKLLDREVNVLFFFENLEEDRVGGIVNPTPEQIGKYQEYGVLQTVRIGKNEAGERPDMILPYIRQSKEFLGETYDESTYRGWDVKSLKKEYLKLFEKVLKAKEKRQDSLRNPQSKL